MQSGGSRGEGKLLFREHRSLDGKGHTMPVLQEKLRVESLSGQMLSGNPPGVPMARKSLLRESRFFVGT